MKKTPNIFLLKMIMMTHDHVIFMKRISPTFYGYHLNFNQFWQPNLRSEKEGDSLLESSGILSKKKNSTFCGSKPFEIITQAIIQLVSSYLMYY